MILKQDGFPTRVGVCLLANGQPRECAYKIEKEKGVLTYIHQALRT